MCMKYTLSKLHLHSIDTHILHLTAFLSPNTAIPTITQSIDCQTLKSNKG